MSASASTSSASAGMAGNFTFFCKTSEGYIIKTLAELLQNNIKNGCFILSKKGIIFRMTDSNKKILIDLEMAGENFVQYKFKNPGVMSIGLNFTHFYKMVKSIKKKDSVVLFIDEEHSNELGIRVIPKEKTRITTSFVKIQNLQSLDIELPEGYDSAVIVPSNEYVKMIKDLNSMGGNAINIASSDNTIKFTCNSNGVYSRDIVFGDGDDEKFSVTQEFEMEQLIRISKVAGLSTQIQIFQAEELPIMFKSNVGNLGKICVYLKDKSMLTEDESEEV
jgi:proliferating cell nuclear antigen PCNA